MSGEFAFKGLVCGGGFWHSGAWVRRLILEKVKMIVAKGKGSRQLRRRRKVRGVA